ncbi:YdiU family protein [Pseudooceanicola sp. 216_PA32_1]|uniref:Protein nucleotidyltransferase YdiU n=1 Tax=Pseudooceanicola pacificus TaxID=2676438 RepID=A0A844WE63_9RHOB|nr:YdiU family protein [Pseudooceanicola pacificus]MWB77229.1 YdiU family protein [Pseudooceanicola pacificus]
MSIAIPFDNTYAALPDGFFTRLGPTPVAAPRLLAFNAPLAAGLGITDLPGEDDLARLFSGNATPEGAAPLAQVYAGHQFGGFSPQLGDGRAILLGEVVDSGGTRRDIQLKGAGPTPYSRMGDGRAWMGPVLREYLVSEAMHALGIPTTRALAAVATGEEIMRELPLPGAVLTRVASSHIRVGTFQYFAARQDRAGLQRLYDYTLARHYPEATDPVEFLEAVIARQARLVAQWMSVGFIHGVMNTDNTSLSGETIDYGPCAFMDAYHPATVYSSIDRQGRYAYQNQPQIVAWNLAQLASCLVALMPDREDAIQRFTAAIHAVPDRVHAEWLTLFRAKLGLATAQDGDEALIVDLLSLMAQNRADFTNTFRALGGAAARDQFLDREGFDTWETRWTARSAGEDGVAERMRLANPAYIPRNHRVEQMIEAAVAGDMAPFERLRQVLAHPFDDQPDAADLASPPAAGEEIQATFCGT